MSLENSLTLLARVTIIINSIHFEAISNLRVHGILGVVARIFLFNAIMFSKTNTRIITENEQNQTDKNSNVVPPNQLTASNPMFTLPALPTFPSFSIDFLRSLLNPNSQSMQTQAIRARPIRIRSLLHSKCCAVSRPLSRG